MTPRNWPGARQGHRGGRHRARPTRRHLVLAWVGAVLALVVVAAMVVLVVAR